MKYQLKLFIIIVVFNCASCESSLPYTIMFSTFSPCDGHEQHSIYFNGSIKRTIQSKYEINGEFTFTERVIDSVEVFLHLIIPLTSN